MLILRTRLVNVTNEFSTELDRRGVQPLAPFLPLSLSFVN